MLWGQTITDCHNNAACIYVDKSSVSCGKQALVAGWKNFYLDTFSYRSHFRSQCFPRPNHPRGTRPAPANLLLDVLHVARTLAQQICSVRCLQFETLELVQNFPEVFVILSALDPRHVHHLARYIECTCHGNRHTLDLKLTVNERQEVDRSVCCSQT